MNLSIRNKYKAYRKQDVKACFAISMAKTDDAFEWCEYAELVKLQWEADFNTFDDSYLECQDLSDYHLKKAKKELHELINRDGVWGLVGYYRTTQDGEWINAESVWGMVGKDDGG